MEFPPARRLRLPLLRDALGRLVAVSTRTGKRLWTKHVGRCEAATPAVGTLARRDGVRDVPQPSAVRRRLKNPADGLLLAIAAGRPHTVRWHRNLGASETSPLLLGKRLYIGTAAGDVYCLQAKTGRTIWRYQVGAPVKGAIAYDGGKVFFGAYDGNLYALGRRRGSSSGRPPRRARSSAATARSTRRRRRVLARVHRLDRRQRLLVRRADRAARVVAPTGGYVYGSPAVADGASSSARTATSSTRLDAATGKSVWTFHAAGPVSGSATVVDGVVYFANLGATARDVRAERAHRQGGLVARTTAASARS